MKPIPDMDSATDRINVALATLRSELRDMRKQDVALMKQMININETIQNIANRRSTFQMKSRNGCKRNNSMYEGPTYVMEALKVKSLKQSTSVPCCAQLSKELSGSLSSIEDDTDSIDSFNISSENVFEETLPVSHSNDFDENPILANSDTNDVISENEHYENILKRNVKLWKYSQLQRNNSFDSDCSESSQVSC